MTVMALKKNNMARTSKSRGVKPFNLRSTNKTSFKNMGSSLPDGRAKSSAFQSDKFASMNKTYDAVTGDMTDEQLRDMTVSQHGGKADKFNVDFRTMQKLRNQKRKKSTKETPTETTKTKTSDTGRKFEQFAISTEDQKRITDKYGMGPDPTGNREKELKRAAEKFANRNLGY